MKKTSIHAICFVAMFAAIICVLSLLTIPTPSGVPLTLQTFAVAFCGFVLGKKYGAVSTGVYICIGLVGVPVFAGMKSGPAVLFGPTGGYLIGFIFLSFFCGLSMSFYRKRRLLVAFFSMLGLTFCHALGIAQLKLYYHMTWAAAAMAGTVPYIVKDIVSVIIAFMMAVTVRRALRAAGLLD